MSTAIRWHYTICAYLPKIVAAGFIRPATAGVPKGERPAVWFSTNPVWEETANKMYLSALRLPVKGTKETTRRFGGGLCRIGVAPETAPHGWLAYQRLSGVKKQHARQLGKKGIEAGANPAEWFVSFEPVPREKWVAVEVWSGQEWVPVGEEVFVPQQPAAAVA